MLSGMCLWCFFLFLMSRVTTAQQVVYNYMPGTDFSKYHTYLLFK